MKSDRIARIIGNEIADGRGKIERRTRLMVDDWKGTIELDGKNYLASCRWPDSAEAHQIDFELKEINEIARALRAIPSNKRSKASAVNGAKGGRPSRPAYRVGCDVEGVDRSEIGSLCGEYGGKTTAAAAIRGYVRAHAKPGVKAHWYVATLDGETVLEGYATKA